jgi:hypothetical protein
MTDRRISNFTHCYNSSVRQRFLLDTTVVPVVLQFLAWRGPDARSKLTSEILMAGALRPHNIRIRNVVFGVSC